ncbi:MAG: flagellar export chaperone FliS [Candidimonas sp.]|nr:MAG: flagellar export chaperone FliS [Candidimonas sp.]
MTPSTHSGAGGRHAAAYARVGLQTRVGSASPTQLIALLLAGARTDITRASLYFSQGNVAARGRAITHALTIVRNGLIAAIDEQQGSVAAQLRHTYELICYLLLQANARRDPAMLERAGDMLRDVELAWSEATDGK